MTDTLILQKKRARCTFRQSVSGPVYDPADITLRIGVIDGNSVDIVETVEKVDLTRESEGVYYYDFIPEISGSFFARFTTNDGVDVETEPFFISAGNTPLA